MMTRFNPLALMLGLFAVLILGSAIFTMSAQLPPQEQVVSQDLSTYDMMKAEPPIFAAPPAAPVMSDLPGAATSDGPDVAVSAAPGVAFNHRYTFQLGAERIPEVQERHAAACEQLGINRCRITAMHYRLGDDGRVEAMLAVRLEPGIARRFGQRASGLVAQADGKLIGADIEGVDAGQTIESTSRTIVQMQAEVRRLEQLLSQRASAEERTAILQEVRQLRASIRSLESHREDDRQALAGTPMEFQYLSGTTLAAAPPLTASKAAERALDTFLQGLTILFIIVVTLLPWALLGLLLWWVAVRLRRRWPSISAEPQAA